MSEETSSTEQTAQGNTDAGEAVVAPEIPPADTGGTPPAEAPWFESLPEDLRGNEVLTRFKDPAELARAYAEALNKVHEAPASPDEYEINVPEGHEVNEEFAKAMRHIAHESGVSKSQMKSLAEKWINLESMVLKQRERDNSAAWDTMKLNLTDSFDSTVSLAEKAAKRFAGEDFAKDIRNRKVHPRAVEVWSQIGKAISDDVIVDGEGAGVRPPIERTRDGMPLLKFG